MAEDNRLGAPTEGLGQTVTFTAGRGGQRSQARGMNRNSPRNAVTGGNISDTSGRIDIPQQQPNVMLKTLTRLAGDVLKPKIEKARQEAFVSGMARVAQGEAVNSIVAEQPWYVGVFGDTDVVEGARAYGSFKKSQEMLQGIEEQLPELQKISPEEFKNKYVTSLFSGVNTGDPTTDALVTKSLIAEVPKLVERQAKGHLGWQQANYANSVREGQLAAASRFAASKAQVNKAASPDDTINGLELSSYAGDSDVASAEVAFVQAFIKPPSIPDEVYNKQTTAVLADMLAKKQLSSYYVLEDSGLVDSLGPDNSKRLRDLADRQESRARAELPLQLVDALADIKSMPALYDRAGVDEVLIKRVSQFNAAYQAHTGAREPYLNGATSAELLSSLRTRQINEARRAREAWAASQDAARDKQAKALEEATAVNETSHSLKQGHPVTGLASELQAKAWARIREEGPEVLAAARIRQSSIADSGAASKDKNGMAYILNNASMAIAGSNVQIWDKLYKEEYLPLVQRGREGVAAQYFGDYATMFHVYHNSRGVDNGNIAQHQGAFALAQAQNFKPLNKGAKSDDQVLREKVKKWSDSMIGPDKVPASQLDMITRRVQPVFNALPETMGDAARIEAANPLANLERAGDFMWDTRGLGSFSQDVNKRSIELGMDVATDEVQDAIGATITKQAKALGIKEPMVVYDASVGKPALSVVGLNDKNQVLSVLITADEVAKANAKVKVKPATNMFQVQGNAAARDAMKRN